MASDASDTTRGVATFGFGGNAGFPQSSDNTGVELTEELSWLPGAATHRIKLGLFLNASHFHQTQTPNGFGTFTYPSLGALEAGEPSKFTRNLVPLEHAGTAWSGAAYLGDTWRGSGLQLAYGVRVETGSFGGAPAYNPTVDSVFGLRTDHIPSDFSVSPRAGFTWIIAGGAPGGGGGRGFGGSAATILRGGFGEFRSPTPTALYSSALAAPGLSTAESELVCVGSAVPVPDWTSYLGDPTAIPTECVDTVTTVAISPHPNATAFDPGFTAPRAWRGSLGVQHRVLGTFTVSLDATYARGVRQYGFRDLNLASAPSFMLPAEGNRPVYVPAAAIVPGTGALSLTDSRIDPEFGQVLEIESNLASDTKQVTAAIGGITGRGAAFQLSYTYARARDQSSFSGGGATQGFAAATTAGDPNLREWATSNFGRRHSVLATITYPLTGGLEVTAIGRLSSGVPFTPLVGSDINGDGARNDRAIIFDPRRTMDAALATGIQSLLSSAPSSVRDCLEGQLGSVAARNSCHGPWQPDARNRALSDTLRSVIEGAGNRPDPAVLFARIRPMLTRGREHGRDALAQAHDVLTPEQWGQLPQSIRSPETRRRRDAPRE